ncbi:MAG: aconitate hydratase AcnA, partial [Actinomycetota bacterium]
IDHSVIADVFGAPDAFERNVELEYQRNHERYSLLRWAQQAFAGFSVVPPGMGIVHQVNLEYIAKVVQTISDDGDVAIPDTLVGTDSHTPMVNGLSVLGWGVGGIEAEAAVLGQPLPMITPKVVGFGFSGSLNTGVTATDLVLTVTEMLRKHGVVGKFVEFHGEGLSSLSVADRATISNMSPEFGATASLWPIDRQTLDYMELTGRPRDLVDLVERYAREQGMWRTDETPAPTFTETLELDLTTVEPSLAGPRRPQDRVGLPGVWSSFTDVYNEDAEKSVMVDLARWTQEGGAPADVPADHESDGHDDIDASELRNGSVVIAAITSCTNTSNPSVMLGAGLLARNARERGLRSKPWVKTSMGPGSRVVTDYLEKTNLMDDLEYLGFHVVGYGCTTCIGNSGPLPEPIAEAVDEHDLAVVSVLSGNRNFEGRIHPQVKASYLASPPLVVAYALAGTANIDLTKDPLGADASGQPVYLADLWPAPEDIIQEMKSVDASSFEKEYSKIFEGTKDWQELPSPTGNLYDWQKDSTYVQEPPFFVDLPPEPAPLRDIAGARALAVLGDSVTTDHISPAGSIPKNGPAARYLREHGVEQVDWNTFGSRRGNHEVMMRGTFGNVRISNALVPDKEGNWTLHFPTGEVVSIYDAAMLYQAEGTPLVILTGKEYGTGSSRDWAAKGPSLLGVRAVIAESYERIHRSNLLMMGVLPLQYLPGQSLGSLGLTGREEFSVTGLDGGKAREVTVRADGKEFRATLRLDT